MIQLRTKLQTPTIEISVKPVDATGQKDSFILGFIGYGAKEADRKLNELTSIYNDENLDVEKRNEIIKEVVKQSIVFIKHLSFTVEDGDKSSSLSIPDTRTVKELEGVWNSAEECLQVCLDILFESQACRFAIVNAYPKALNNTDFTELKAKN